MPIFDPRIPARIDQHLRHGLPQLNLTLVGVFDGAVDGRLFVAERERVAFQQGDVEEGVEDVVGAVAGADVEQMVAHRVGGGVEEVGDGLLGVFGLGLQGGEDVGEELDVVAPTGFEDLFFWGRALGLGWC